MTGNFEQPKHTGARDAWPEASTSLVQADDILMPEEVARLTVSLCSPALCFAEVATLVATGLAQPGLKVPDSWVYEKTRGRCRNYRVPLRLLRCSLPLRFAQPGRNRADSTPASRALRVIQLGAPCFAYSGNMADRPGAPGQKSGMAEASQPPERGAPDLTKTGLKLRKTEAHTAANRGARIACRPIPPPVATIRRVADKPARGN